MKEVELIPLREGESYRARSRRDPRKTHKLTRNERGEWSCTCEANYYQGHLCGHLNALQTHFRAAAYPDEEVAIFLAPARYDPDRYATYEDWRAGQ